MDCSLPGSSVHGILQAWLLEWVAISFSSGSSQPRNQTWVLCIAGRLFADWATKEALIIKWKYNEVASWLYASIHSCSTHQLQTLLTTKRWTARQCLQRVRTHMGDLQGALLCGGKVVAKQYFKHNYVYVFLKNVYRCVCVCVCVPVRDREAVCSLNPLCSTPSSLQMEKGSFSSKTYQSCVWKVIGSTGEICLTYRCSSLMDRRTSPTSQARMKAGTGLSGLDLELEVDEASWLRSRKGAPCLRVGDTMGGDSSLTELKDQNQNNKEIFCINLCTWKLWISQQQPAGPSGNSPHAHPPGVWEHVALTR